jgi:hypothetical protein
MGVVLVRAERRSRRQRPRASVLHGELHQEWLHSQRVELAKNRDVRSEDGVGRHLGAGELGDEA